MDEKKPAGDKRAVLATVEIEGVIAASDLVGAIAHIHIHEDDPISIGLITVALQRAVQEMAAQVDATGLGIDTERETLTLRSRDGQTLN